MESLTVVTETFPAGAEGLTAVAEASPAAAENKTVAENRVRGGKWVKVSLAEKIVIKSLKLSPVYQR